MSIEQKKMNLIEAALVLVNSPSIKAAAFTANLIESHLIQPYRG